MAYGTSLSQKYVSQTKCFTFPEGSTHFSKTSSYWLKHYHQQMMFLMEAFDANQDGRLDLDEMLEMLVALLG